MLNSNLISKLYLDDNNLDGNQLSLILDGLDNQVTFKFLAIQSNQIDMACVKHILNLLKRRVPNHMDELHLIYAKC